MKNMIIKDKNNVPMFEQILLTSNIGNVWKRVTRIYMLILRLKGGSRGCSTKILNLGNNQMASSITVLR